MDDFFREQIIDLTEKAKSRTKKKSTALNQTKEEKDAVCCELEKYRESKVSAGWGNPA